MAKKLVGFASNEVSEIIFCKGQREFPQDSFDLRTSKNNRPLSVAQKEHPAHPPETCLRQMCCKNH